MSLNLKNWIDVDGDGAEWHRGNYMLVLGASYGSCVRLEPIECKGDIDEAKEIEQAIRDLAGVEDLPEPIGMTGVVNFSEDVSLHSDRDGHYVYSQRAAQRWPVNNWREGVAKVRELLGLP